MQGMRNFNIYDYRRQCPIAHSVESALNNYALPSENLEKLKGVLTQTIPSKFFGACLKYWSEAEYYDDRNRVAVLVSREIVKKFPNVPLLSINGFSEKTLSEAYGFTHFAHRYIQEQLFKVILEYLKQKNSPIYQWYEQQQFVIDATNDMAIPSVKRFGK